MYLGASRCIYFLAHDVFIFLYLFLCDVYVRGRHYVFLFLFLVSHYATFAIDLYYEVIHDICLLFYVL